MQSTTIHREDFSPVQYKLNAMDSECVNDGESIELKLKVILFVV